jgi:hypothetical protein
MGKILNKTQQSKVKTSETLVEKATKCKLTKINNGFLLGFHTV